MFRFTIRELVLLTIIVAMGVGWWIRDRELRTALGEASRWRKSAASLEELLGMEGWSVAYGSRDDVMLTRKSNWHGIERSYNFVHHSRSGGFTALSQFKPPIQKASSDEN